MPGSVTVAAANTCWSKPNQRGRVKAYLAYLCQHADILLLQECRDVAVAPLLPPGWATNQDTRDGGTRGSCIAWRKALGEPFRFPLVLGARGLDIQPRYISHIYFLGITWASAHSPLRITGLQPIFTHREKAFASGRPTLVIGTDANRKITRLGAILGMESHEAPRDRIIGQLSKGVSPVKVWADSTGERNGWTDHPAFFARYPVAATIPARPAPKPAPPPAPAPTGGTMPLVIDYAWSHPNPHAIRAAGYVGVMRYLSHDPSKDLSVLEAAGLHAAGLGIGLVFESTATRSTAGFVAGQQDARFANARADALGYPKSCPLFYAVDFDASAGQVAGYFAGVVAAGGRPVGIYGGHRVESAHQGLYRWETTAWSGGVVDSGAHLFQRVKPTRNLAGSFDENVVLRPFPMWGTGAPRRPAPTPAPKPVPKPAPKPVHNHVTVGRGLVEQGLAEIKQAPASRQAVHSMADAIAAALKEGPAS